MSATSRRELLCRLAFTSAALTGAAAARAEPPADPPRVEVTSRENEVLLRAGGEAVATYCFRDPAIPRPYFAHVKAPGGIQVTRAHPPVPGQDPTDHAGYHPGLFMAFGDLSGADSWRLKALVRHDGFAAPPRSGSGRGSFAVKNVYLSENGAGVLARERCQVTLLTRPAGTLLLWDSRFTPGEVPLVFGDQEEMGLGVRVATPLTVTRGGEIRDSEGRKNEAQVRGQAPDWCDYSGVVDGRRAGVTLMSHPRNFRRSWMHARDYGILVANPFGRRALTGGEESRVVVQPDAALSLRYGILLHSSPEDKPVDLRAAYQDYLRQAGE
ncbi:MAG: DUF6807 family protein [Armatimonadota bacterium]